VDILLGYDSTDTVWDVDSTDTVWDVDSTDTAWDVDSTVTAWDVDSTVTAWDVAAAHQKFAMYSPARQPVGDSLTGVKHHHAHSTAGMPRTGGGAPANKVLVQGKVAGATQLTLADFKREVRRCKQVSPIPHLYCGLIEQGLILIL
jgi:hypothetical protein